MTIFLVLLGAFAFICSLTMLFSPAEAWWPQPPETKHNQQE
jgi:hypothetical protein